MGKCLNCGEEAANRCSRCKLVYFCSPDCQKKMWKKHKLDCHDPNEKNELRQSSPNVPVHIMPADSKTKGLSEEELAFQVFVHRVKDRESQKSLPEFVKMMLVPSGFRATAYPGTLDKSAQTKHNDLQELLNDANAADLVREISKEAFVKAKNILAGVKARGASMKEVMPPEVEKSMWPQIYAESFCRSICTVIKAHSLQTTSKLAEDETLFASPVHVLAHSDQIEVSTMADLLSSGGCGFARQNGPFQGEEDDIESWMELIGDDMSRFFSMENSQRLFLSPLSESSRTCCIIQGTEDEKIYAISTSRQRSAWIDAGTQMLELLESEFPAFQELVTHFQGMPYELNRKNPSLRLLRPMEGRTLLWRFDVELEFSSKFTKKDTQLSSQANEGIIPLLSSQLNAKGNDIQAPYKICVIFLPGMKESEDMREIRKNGIDVSVELKFENDGKSLSTSLRKGNQLIFYRFRDRRPSLFLKFALDPKRELNLEHLFCRKFNVSVDFISYYFVGMED